jgi:hypothetical protein
MDLGLRFIVDFSLLWKILVIFFVDDFGDFLDGFCGDIFG